STDGINVEWTKWNGQEHVKIPNMFRVEPNRLILDRATQDAVGDYRVQVSNRFGTDKQDLRINVAPRRMSIIIKYIFKLIFFLFVFKAQLPGVPSAPQVSIQPETYEVRQGETINIVPIINSQSKYNVVWLKDGSRQLPNGVSTDRDSLVVHAEDADVDGDYTIQVMNEHASATAPVKIRFSPSGTSTQDQFQVRIQGPKSVRVRPGQDVQLICEVTANPQPYEQVQFTWQKQGVEIPNGSDGRLILRNVEDRDLGIYICTASISGQVATSDMVTLGLESSPVRVSLSWNIHQIELNEGQRLEALCQFTPNINSPSSLLRLSTTKNRLPVQQPLGLQFSNGLLTLSAVSRQDDGLELKCSAPSISGSPSDTLYIRVRANDYPNDGRYYQQPESERNGLTARFDSVDPSSHQTGRDIRLQCSVDADIEKPIRYSYTKDGRPLVDNVEVHPNGLLIIKDAQTSDAGRYICDVYSERTGSSTKAVYDLQLHDYNHGGYSQQNTEQSQQNTEQSQQNIEVSVSPKDVNIVYGETGNITCIVKGTNNYKLTWGKYAHDTTLPNYAKQVHNSVIISPPADRDLSDEMSYYQCQVEIPGETQPRHDYVVVNLTQPRFVAPQISIYPSNNVILKFGEYTRLTCSVRNIDSSTRIIWEREDGRPLLQSNGVTLELRSVTKADVGTYTCHASNRGGESTAQAIVKVQGALPTVRILPVSNQVLNVQVGSVSTVICLGDGDPLPRLSWRKHNSSYEYSQNSWLNNNEGLRLFPQMVMFDQSHRGVYSCAGTNIYGTAHESFTLEVLPVHIPTAYQPTIKIYPPNVQITSGSNIEIYCRVDGTRVLQYLWSRNGENLLSNINTRDALMNIQNASVENSGYYTCIALTEQGKLEKELMINIQPSPFVQITPTSSSPIIIDIQPKGIIRYGTHLQLHCILPNANSIWWTDEGGSTKGFEQHGNTLILILEPHHIGNKYICNVRDKDNRHWSKVVHIHKSNNDEGVQTTQFTTSNTIEENARILETATPNVVRPLLVQLHPLPGSVFNVGKTIKIGCRSSDPTASISWSRVNGKQFSRFTRPHQANLRFQKYTSDDSGTYVCRARNQRYSIEKRLSINIEPDGKTVKVFYGDTPMSVSPGSPNINITFLTPQSQLRVGGIIDVECVVSGTDNTIPIKWSHELNKMSDNVEVTGSRLRINRFQSHNLGTYVCQVQTSVGNLTRSLHFLPEDISGIDSKAVKPTLSFQFLSSRADFQNGGRIIVECISSDQAAKINWNKTNSLPSKSVVFNDRFLIIDPFSEKDLGVYQCKGRNVHGSTTKTLDLTRLDFNKQLLPTSSDSDIHAPVIQLIFNPNNSYRVDGTVHVKCITPDKTTTVTWNRGSDAKFSYDTSVTDGNLLIQRLNKYDLGVYTCMGSNPHGTSYKSFELIAQDDHMRITNEQNGTMPDVTQNDGVSKIHFEFQSPLRELKLGGNVIVNCYLDQNANDTSLSWSLVSELDQKYLSLPNNVYTDRSRLSFRNFSTKHFGSYQCEAQLSNGNRIQKILKFDAKTFSAIRNEKYGKSQRPRLRFNTSFIDVRGKKQLGENIVMICRIGKDTPIGKIEWKKLNDIVSVKVQQKGARLEFKSFTFEHHGVYICRIKSPQTTRTIQIDTRNIIVDNPKKKPNLTLSTDPNTGVRLGDDLKLICTKVEGETVRWMKINLDGQQRSLDKWIYMSNSSSETLLIPNIDENDYGTYTCQASNNFGQSSVNYTIDKTTMTEKQISPPNVRIEILTPIEDIDIGRNLQLKCISDNTRSKYKWYAPNERNVFSTQTLLSLKPFKKQDIGTWTCKVSILSSHEIYTASVLLPPPSKILGDHESFVTIKTYPDLNLIYIGTNYVTIACLTNLYIGELKFNNSAQMPNNVKRIGTHLIVIEKFAEKNVGVYECSTWRQTRKAIVRINKRILSTYRKIITPTTNKTPLFPSIEIEWLHPKASKPLSTKENYQLFSKIISLRCIPLDDKYELNEHNFVWTRDFDSNFVYYGQNLSITFDKRSTFDRYTCTFTAENRNVKINKTIDLSYIPPKLNVAVDLVKFIEPHERQNLNGKHVILEGIKSDG
ncbi:unnamed protein product, partial [Didymodactylos carnosus]